MRAWNFSAGPAAIPVEVLERAQQELLEFGSQQASIMEISHRSKDYEAVAFGARDNLRSLLNISEDFEILFLQGGATLQFALLPLNFAQNKTTEHIITGAWSKKAHAEASKLGSAHILATSADTNFTTIPELNNLSPSDGAAYLHYADNETIHGVEFKRVPDINLPKFVDMSSIILGKQIDVNQYDLIYAGAQKNIGPAGLTVVIARKKLLETCNESIPSILNLQKHAENDSMLNTPPTFAWYLAGLVFEWYKVPAGKTANSASIGAIDWANCPLTVETICITCEYFSICINCVTSTEPALQTRPKSFLPKSTSIRCSARSFGSLSNSLAIVSSSSGVPPLGLVPAIG